MEDDFTHHFYVRATRPTEPAFWSIWFGVAKCPHAKDREMAARFPDGAHMVMTVAFPTHCEAERAEKAVNAAYGMHCHDDQRVLACYALATRLKLPYDHASRDAYRALVARFCQAVLAVLGKASTDPAVSMASAA